MNVPSPLPRKNATELDCPIARSGIPSPLKSPTAMDWGVAPVTSAWDGVVQFGWAAAGRTPAAMATRKAHRRRKWRALPGRGLKKARVGIIRYKDSPVAERFAAMSEIASI